MLDDKDLAYMRECLEEFLPDTCTILSPTETPDGMGGVDATWGTSSANVACRLDHKKTLSQDEIVTGASLRPFTSYILSVPYDTTITTDYRVVHSSITYNVVTVNTDQSWKSVTRCTLERV